MAIALRQALAAADVTGRPAAVAYVDDAILMTKAADLLATHQAVQQIFSTLGLSLQHRKTRLWAPGVTERQRQFLADNLECQLAEHGLLVCGQPLCPHPFEEDFVPLGDDSFIQEQLAKILRSFDADLQRLRHLATMWPETMGHQLLCIMVRNMFPSRVLHLLRAVPHVHIMPFWEQVQQLLRAALADMLQVSTIPAQSWTLLNMPLQFGGGGFAMPDILPAATRAVALMQLPQLESAMPHIRQSFQAEIAGLEEQLTAAMAFPASTLLRAQPEQDSPVSVRSLQKRILRMCHLQSARAFRKQLASQDHSLAQEFERNLAYDDLKGQPVHEGLGAWLLHVPAKEHEQIPNAALSWALKLRVGLPLGPMPARCARLLPSGSRCAAVLDVQHVHALTCSQAIALKRHNAVKHSLHMLALSAGASAASEQRAVWSAADRAPRAKGSAHCGRCHHG